MCQFNICVILTGLLSCVHLVIGETSSLYPSSTTSGENGDKFIFTQSLPAESDRQDSNSKNTDFKLSDSSYWIESVTVINNSLVLTKQRMTSQITKEASGSVRTGEVTLKELNEGELEASGSIFETHRLKDNVFDTLPVFKIKFDPLGQDITTISFKDRLKVDLEAVIEDVLNNKNRTKREINGTNIEIEVQDIQSSGPDKGEATFVVKVNGKPVEGAAATDILNQLTPEELNQYLGVKVLEPASLVSQSLLVSSSVLVDQSVIMISTSVTLDSILHASFSGENSVFLSADKTTQFVEKGVILETETIKLSSSASIQTEDKIILSQSTYIDVSSFESSLHSYAIGTLLAKSSIVPQSKSAESHSVAISISHIADSEVNVLQSTFIDSPVLQPSLKLGSIRTLLAKSSVVPQNINDELHLEPSSILQKTDIEGVSASVGNRGNVTNSKDLKLSLLPNNTRQDDVTMTPMLTENDISLYVSNSNKLFLATSSVLQTKVNGQTDDSLLELNTLYKETVISSSSTDSSQLQKQANAAGDTNSHVSVDPISSLQIKENAADSHVSLDQSSSVELRQIAADSRVAVDQSNNRKLPEDRSILLDISSSLQPSAMKEESYISNLYTSMEQPQLTSFISSSSNFSPSRTQSIGSSPQTYRETILPTPMISSSSTITLDRTLQSLDSSPIIDKETTFLAPVISSSSTFTSGGTQAMDSTPQIDKETTLLILVSSLITVDTNAQFLTPSRLMTQGDNPSSNVQSSYGEISSDHISNESNIKQLNSELTPVIPQSVVTKSVFSEGSVISPSDESNIEQLNSAVTKAIPQSIITKSVFSEDSVISPSDESNIEQLNSYLTKRTKQASIAESVFSEESVISPSVPFEDLYLSNINPSSVLIYHSSKYDEDIRPSSVNLVSSNVDVLEVLLSSVENNPNYLLNNSSVGIVKESTNGFYESVDNSIDQSVSVSNADIDNGLSSISSSFAAENITHNFVESTGYPEQSITNPELSVSTDSSQRVNSTFNLETSKTVSVENTGFGTENIAIRPHVYSTQNTVSMQSESSLVVDITPSSVLPMELTSESTRSDSSLVLDINPSSEILSEITSVSNTLSVPPGSDSLLVLDINSSSEILSELKLVSNTLSVPIRSDSSLVVDTDPSSEILSEITSVANTLGVPSESDSLLVLDINSSFEIPSELTSVSNTLRIPPGLDSSLVVDINSSTDVLSELTSVSNTLRIPPGPDSALVVDMNPSSGILSEIFDSSMVLASEFSETENAFSSRSQVFSEFSLHNERNTMPLSSIITHTPDFTAKLKTFSTIISSTPAFTSINTSPSLSTNANVPYLTSLPINPLPFLKTSAISITNNLDSTFSVINLTPTLTTTATMITDFTSSTINPTPTLKTSSFIHNSTKDLYKDLSERSTLETTGYNDTFYSNKQVTQPDNMDTFSSATKGALTELDSYLLSCVVDPGGQDVNSTAFKDSLVKDLDILFTSAIAKNSAGQRQKRAASADVSVKIQDVKELSPNSVEAQFTVTLDGQPVQAAEAVSMLNTLTDEEIQQIMNIKVLEPIKAVNPSTSPSIQLTKTTQVDTMFDTLQPSQIESSQFNSPSDQSILSKDVFEDTPYPTGFEDATHPTISDDMPYPSVSDDTPHSTHSEDTPNLKVSEDTPQPTHYEDTPYLSVSEDATYPTSSEDMSHPSISEDTTNPTVSKDTSQPTVSEDLPHSTISNDMLQPTVSEDTPQLTISEYMSQATLSEYTTYLSVSEDATYPTSSEDMSHPSISEDTTNPTVSKDTSQPTVSEDLPHSTISNDMLQPTVSEDTPQLTISEYMSQATISEYTTYLSVSEDATYPTLPEDISHPSIPEDMSQATVSEKTPHPSIFEDLLQPTVSADNPHSTNTLHPTVSKDNVHTSVSDDKPQPTVSENTPQPTVSENTPQPTMSEDTLKPSVSNNNPHSTNTLHPTVSEDTLHPSVSDGTPHSTLSEDTPHPTVSEDIPHPTVSEDIPHPTVSEDMASLTISEEKLDPTNSIQSDSFSDQRLMLSTDALEDSLHPTPIESVVSGVNFIESKSISLTTLLMSSNNYPESKASTVVEQDVISSQINTIDSIIDSSLEVNLDSSKSTKNFDTLESSIPDHQNILNTRSYTDQLTSIKSSTELDLDESTEGATTNSGLDVNLETLEYLNILKSGTLYMESSQYVRLNTTYDSELFDLNSITQLSDVKVLSTDIFSITPLLSADIIHSTPTRLERHSDSIINSKLADTLTPNDPNLEIRSSNPIQLYITPTNVIGVALTETSLDKSKAGDINLYSSPMTVSDILLDASTPVSEKSDSLVIDSIHVAFTETSLDESTADQITKSKYINFYSLPTELSDTLLDAPTPVLEGSESLVIDSIHDSIHVTLNEASIDESTAQKLTKSEDINSPVSDILLDASTSVLKGLDSLVIDSISVALIETSLDESTADQITKSEDTNLYSSPMTLSEILLDASTLVLEETYSLVIDSTPRTDIVNDNIVTSLRQYDTDDSLASSLNDGSLFAPVYTSISSMLTHNLENILSNNEYSFSSYISIKPTPVLYSSVKNTMSSTWYTHTPYIQPTSSIEDAKSSSKRFENSLSDKVSDTTTSGESLDIDKRDIKESFVISSSLVFDSEKSISDQSVVILSSSVPDEKEIQSPISIFSSKVVDNEGEFLSDYQTDSNSDSISKYTSSIKYISPIMSSYDVDELLSSVTRSDIEIFGSSSISIGIVSFANEADMVYSTPILFDKTSLDFTRTESLDLGLSIVESSVAMFTNDSVMGSLVEDVISETLTNIYVDRLTQSASGSLPLSIIHEESANYITMTSVTHVLDEEISDAGDPMTATDVQISRDYIALSHSVYLSSPVDSDLSSENSLTRTDLSYSDTSNKLSAIYTSSLEPAATANTVQTLEDYDALSSSVYLSSSPVESDLSESLLTRHSSYTSSFKLATPADDIQTSRDVVTLLSSNYLSPNVDSGSSYSDTLYSSYTTSFELATPVDDMQTSRDVVTLLSSDYLSPNVDSGSSYSNTLHPSYTTSFELATTIDVITLKDSMELSSSDHLSPVDIETGFRDKPVMLQSTYTTSFTTADEVQILEDSITSVSSDHLSYPDVETGFSDMSKSITLYWSSTNSFELPVTTTLKLLEFPETDTTHSQLKSSVVDDKPPISRFSVIPTISQEFGEGTFRSMTPVTTTPELIKSFETDTTHSQLESSVVDDKLPISKFSVIPTDSQEEFAEGTFGSMTPFTTTAELIKSSKTVAVYSQIESAVVHDTISISTSFSVIPINSQDVAEGTFGSMTPFTITVELIESSETDTVHSQIKSSVDDDTSLVSIATSLSVIPINSHDFTEEILASMTPVTVIPSTSTTPDKSYQPSTVQPTNNGLSTTYISSSQSIMVPTTAAPESDLTRFLVKMVFDPQGQDVTSEAFKAQLRSSLLMAFKEALKRRQGQRCKRDISEPVISVKIQKTGKVNDKESTAVFYVTVDDMPVLAEHTEGLFADYSTKELDEITGVKTLQPIAAVDRPIEASPVGTPQRSSDLLNDAHRSGIVLAPSKHTNDVDILPALSTARQLLTTSVHTNQLTSTIQDKETTTPSTIILNVEFPSSPSSLQTIQPTAIGHETKIHPSSNSQLINIPPSVSTPFIPTIVPIFSSELVEVASMVFVSDTVDQTQTTLASEEIKLTSVYDELTPSNAEIVESTEVTTSLFRVIVSGTVDQTQTPRDSEEIKPTTVAASVINDSELTLSEAEIVESTNNMGVKTIIRSSALQTIDHTTVTDTGSLDVTDTGSLDVTDTGSLDVINTYDALNSDLSDSLDRFKSSTIRSSFVSEGLSTSLSDALETSNTFNNLETSNGFENSNVLFSDPQSSLLATTQSIDTGPSSSEGPISSLEDQTETIVNELSLSTASPIDNLVSSTFGAPDILSESTQLILISDNMTTPFSASASGETLTFSEQTATVDNNYIITVTVSSNTPFIDTNVVDTVIESPLTQTAVASLDAFNSIQISQSRMSEYNATPVYNDTNSSTTVNDLITPEISFAQATIVPTDTLYPSVLPSSDISEYDMTMVYNETSSPTTVDDLMITDTSFAQTTKAGVDLASLTINTGIIDTSILLGSMLESSEIQESIGTADILSFATDLDTSNSLITGDILLTPTGLETADLETDVGTSYTILPTIVLTGVEDASSSFKSEQSTVYVSMDSVNMTLSPTPTISTSSPDISNVLPSLVLENISLSRNMSGTNDILGLRTDSLQIETLDNLKTTFTGLDNGLSLISSFEDSTTPVSIMPEFSATDILPPSSSPNNNSILNGSNYSTDVTSDSLPISIQTNTLSPNTTSNVFDSDASSIDIAISKSTRVIKYSASVIESSYSFAEISELIATTLTASTYNEPTTPEISSDQSAFSELTSSTDSILNDTETVFIKESSLPETSSRHVSADNTAAASPAAATDNVDSISGTSQLLTLEDLVLSSMFSEVTESTKTVLQELTLSSTVLPELTVLEPIRSTVTVSNDHDESPMSMDTITNSANITPSPTIDMSSSSVLKSNLQQLSLQTSAVTPSDGLTSSLPELASTDTVAGTTTEFQPSESTTLPETESLPEFTSTDAMMGTVVFTPSQSTSLLLETEIILPSKSSSEFTSKDTIPGTIIVSKPPQSTAPQETVLPSKSLPELTSTVTVPTSTTVTPTLPPTTTPSSDKMMVISVSVKSTTNITDGVFKKQIETGLALVYVESINLANTSGRRKRDLAGALTNTRNKRDLADVLFLYKRDTTDAVTVNVVNTERDGGTSVTSQFYVNVNEEPLPASEAVPVYNRLNNVEKSALLGHPVLGPVRALGVAAPAPVTEPEEDRTKILFIVAIVLPCVLVLLLIAVLARCYFLKKENNLYYKRGESLEDHNLTVDVEKGDIISGRSSRASQLLSGDYFSDTSRKIPLEFDISTDENSLSPKRKDSTMGLVVSKNQKNADLAKRYKTESVPTSPRHSENDSSITEKNNIPMSEIPSPKKPATKQQSIHEATIEKTEVGVTEHHVLPPVPPHRKVTRSATLERSRGIEVETSPEQSPKKKKGKPSRRNPNEYYYLTKKKGDSQSISSESGDHTDASEEFTILVPKSKTARHLEGYSNRMFTDSEMTSSPISPIKRQKTNRLEKQRKVDSQSLRRSRISSIDFDPCYSPENSFVEEVETPLEDYGHYYSGYRDRDYSQEYPERRYHEDQLSYPNDPEQYYDSEDRLHVPDYRQDLYNPEDDQHQYLNNDNDVENKRGYRDHRFNTAGFYQGSKDNTLGFSNDILLNRELQSTSLSTGYHQMTTTDTQTSDQEQHHDSHLLKSNPMTYLDPKTRDMKTQTTRDVGAQLDAVEEVSLPVNYMPDTIPSVVVNRSVRIQESTSEPISSRPEESHVNQHTSRPRSPREAQTSPANSRSRSPGTSQRHPPLYNLPSAEALLHNNWMFHPLAPGSHYQHSSIQNQLPFPAYPNYAPVYPNTMNLPQTRLSQPLTSSIQGPVNQNNQRSEPEYSSQHPTDRINWNNQTDRINSSMLHSQPVIHSRMARFNPYEGLPPEPPAVRYQHIPEPNFLLQPEFPPLDSGIERPENSPLTFYQDPFENRQENNNTDPGPRASLHYTRQFEESLDEDELTKENESSMTNELLVSQLLSATKKGDREQVLSCLYKLDDINATSKNGLTALQVACKEGHLEIVKELIRKGSNVHAVSKKGNTALHIASLAGQLDVVRVLVEHDVNINAQAKGGFTSLYMAAQEGHTDVVRYLLDNGASQHIPTKDGFTPLAVALQQGHEGVYTILIKIASSGKVHLPTKHNQQIKPDEESHSSSHKNRDRKKRPSKSNQHRQGDSSDRSSSPRRHKKHSPHEDVNEDSFQHSENLDSRNSENLDSKHSNKSSTRHSNKSSSRHSDKSSKRHDDDSQLSSPRQHKDDKPKKEHKTKHRHRQDETDKDKQQTSRDHDDVTDDVSDRSSPRSPRRLTDDDKSSQIVLKTKHKKEADSSRPNNQKSSPRSKYYEDETESSRSESLRSDHSVVDKQDSDSDQYSDDSFQSDSDTQSSQVSNPRKSNRSKPSTKADYSSDESESELSDTSPSDSFQNDKKRQSPDVRHSRPKTRMARDEESDVSQTEESSSHDNRDHSNHDNSQLNNSKDDKQNNEKHKQNGEQTLYSDEEEVSPRSRNIRFEDEQESQQFDKQNKKTSPRKDPQDLYSQIKLEMLKSYKDLNRKTAKSMPDRVENLTDDQLLLLYEFHRRRLLFQGRQEASVKAKVLVNEAFLTEEIRRLRKQQQNAKKKMKKILDDAFPSTCEKV